MSVLVQVEAEVLAAALAQIARAVESKASIPILAAVYLEARPGAVVLRGTDFQVDLTTEIPAEGEDAFSACVVHRHLAGVIKSLSGKITLGLDGQRLVVKSKSGRSRLVSYNPDTFPKPVVAEGKAAPIPMEVLRPMLERTAFTSPSNDDSRWVLSGVKIETVDGKTVSVATDGLSLSFTEGPGLAIENMFIPLRAVDLIRSLDGEVVQTLHSDSHLFFEAGATRLAVRKQVGEFPAWRKILPSQFKLEAMVSSSVLQKALERAVVFSTKNQNHAAQFIFTGEELVVKTSSAELGECEERLPAGYKIFPRNVEVCLNANLVLAFLSRAAGDIFIGVPESGPVLFRQGTDWSYLVSPVVK